MRAFPADLARALRDRGRGLTVLVLRFGALGDVLRTLPAVRLVRRGLPEARLAWAVAESLAGVLDGHPDLDAVLRFPRRQWSTALRSVRGWPSLPRRVRAWKRELRELAPGLVLDFHGDLKSGLTGRLSGAPVRLGYEGHQQKEANAWLTTHRVPAGERRRSRMERNLDLVRALGLPVEPLPDGGLPVSDKARETAGALVAREGRSGVAVIAPGVSVRQAYKKPPAALLAAAARELDARNVAPLVVFGPGEQEDAQRVVELAAGAARLAPPTTLDQLAALLARARLFVGGDTGPMHLACAVRCPVVALYGPTDPCVNAPWGVPHVALHPPGRDYTGIKRLDRRHGFEGLTAAAVVQAIGAVLDRDDAARDAPAEPAAGPG